MNGTSIRPVSPRYRIQAIERAVSILNAFSMDDPELGVTELADRLGLHKSTVHRFMVNLDAAGLVERNARTGRYRLGLHVFELGALVMQQMNLWDEALPFLEGLVHDTGETGHLAVLDGGEAIYIERVEARRALRVPSAIGRGYPAHATNLGKVLLADLPRERVEAIIAERGLAAYTSQTITDPAELEADLELIRRRGYAVDNEEYDEGLRCIGAAVRDHSGHVVAALGIGGPVTRITPERVEELGGLVMTAARGLSRRLGAHQSGAYASATLRVRTTASEEPALRPANA
jgi:DNA-binding IclR family transcriptional regulator